MPKRVCEEKVRAVREHWMGKGEEDERKEEEGAREAVTEGAVG